MLVSVGHESHVVMGKFYFTFQSGQQILNIFLTDTAKLEQNHFT